MDKVAVVLPYGEDALAYPDDAVLTLAEAVLLDDGRMDETKDCRHTWLDRDLPVHHNEVVEENTNSLVDVHDTEAVHRKDRNA